MKEKRKLSPRQAPNAWTLVILIAAIVILVVGMVMVALIFEFEVFRMLQF